MGAAAPAKERVERPDSGGAEPWRTVLFNCDCHSFDAVERQLIKAIRCPLGRARAIAYAVHTKGSEVVYTGPRERCEAVADVLGAVGLVVKVSR